MNNEARQTQARTARWTTTREATRGIPLLAALFLVLPHCSPSPRPPGEPPAARPVEMPSVSPSTSGATTPLASSSAPASLPEAKALEDIDREIPVSADSKLPLSYPAGLVPKDLLDSLEANQFPPSPPLANATPCRRRLMAEPEASPPGCAWRIPSILAFHAGKNQVAFLDAKNHNDRNDCPVLLGVIAPLGKAGAPGEEQPFTRAKTENCPQGTTIPEAVSNFALQLQNEGYENVQDLIGRSGYQTFGAWSYRPLAVLRAPLQGYLLHAIPRTTKVELSLIAPDNKTHFALGSTPLTERTCIERNDKGDCRKSTTQQEPSVHQVALSPDRKHLVVLLKLNTPEGHDTLDSYRRLIFSVPPKLIESPGNAP